MKLRVYTLRWGHEDTYKVKLTGDGWLVESMSSFMSGKCNKKGEPYLFRNLDHDSVSYPANLGEYMEWLWQQADTGKYGDEEIQEALDELGDWISRVEKSSPTGGVWKGFK